MLNSIRFWNNTVILLAIINTVYFTLIGFHHYYNLSLGGDFAFFVQVFWNHQNGIHYYTTLEDGGRSSLGTHVSFTTLPLALLLAPFSIPHSLLFIQAILCSSVSVIIYHIAMHKGIAPIPACILSICWILSPLTQAALLFDFHILTVSPFFIFLGIYMWEQKKLFWAGGFFLFAMLSREDVSLWLFFLFLTFLCKKDNMKYSVLGMIICMVYFIVAVKWIQPNALAGQHTTFDPAFSTFMQNPFRWVYNALFITEMREQIFSLAKLKYLFFMFCSFVFIPLICRTSWILLIPVFALVFISNNWLMYTIHHSYPTHYGILPALTIAYMSLDGMKNAESMFDKKFRILISTGLLLIISIFSTTLSFVTPYQYVLGANWSNWYDQTNHSKHLFNVMNQIPPKASVVTTRYCKTAFAQRRHIWEWVDHDRSNFPESLEKAEFIILDLDYLEINDKKGLQAIDSELPRHNFEIVRDDGYILIAKKVKE